MRLAYRRTIDERTRGMGGLQASCGEENLLSLDVDPRYTGRDILTHEMAHTLMDYGLPPKARQAIEAAYEASVVERGLWRRPDGSKAYAATSEDAVARGLDKLPSPHRPTIIICSPLL